MWCNLGNNDRITNGDQTVSIDQLCDDVLLEVFSHLNGKELKNASLVAKRWNELIGSSVSTMRKFRLRVTDDRISRRKHQNFGIETTKTTDWTKIPLQLDSVRTLRIQGGEFFHTINSDKVFTFLSRLTELEELSFENMRLIHGTDDAIQPIEMPKLKILRIIGDDFTILRHIDARDLQQLQCIRENDNWSRPEDFESIAESIVRFCRVESLILWNCMEAFEHIDVRQVQCQLNSFEAYHPNICPTDVTVFEENLQQFVVLQADCLRDLTFDCSMLHTDHRLEKDVLRLSFNKCTKLTSLDIRDLSIPREDIFYQSLLPNYSITTLKVQWSDEDCNVIDGLLKNCPKLTRLDVELCRLSGGSIKSISTFCPELIHLHIYELLGCVSGDTFFNHLRCLNIYNVETPFESLLALLATCPNLEQIRIDKCESAESFPMDKITRLLSMKRLKVAGKVYDILKGRRQQIGIAP